MEAQDIERYLSFLGEVLQEANVQVPIDLLLVGGGYMLTQIGNRGATSVVAFYFIGSGLYKPEIA